METTVDPMTQPHLLETLLAAIVFAGILGGLVNFYQSRQSDPDDNSLWKSITLGIGAAFLVPLFLTMILSKLIEAIRADTKLAQTPVMAVTAYAGKADEERARAAGADAYVSKPISLMRFVDAVEGLMRPAPPMAIEAPTKTLHESKDANPLT